jgi:hypothetical protein
MEMVIYVKSYEVEEYKNLSPEEEVAKLNEEFVKCDFEEIPMLHKNCSSVDVRKWYKWHDENIVNLLDKTKPIEIQARLAHELRNKYRTQARDLMKDQEHRKKLDKKRPNISFEDLIKSKINRKNMTRDEAIKDILKTALKTNKQVNKSLGLE